MRSITELATAQRRGDKIPTIQLKRLFSHYLQLEALLNPLGERWHFAWNEARRIRDECDEYLTARRQRA